MYSFWRQNELPFWLAVRAAPGEPLRNKRRRSAPRRSNLHNLKSKGQLFVWRGFHRDKSKRNPSFRSLYLPLSSNHSVKGSRSFRCIVQLGHLRRCKISLTLHHRARISCLNGCVNDVLNTNRSGGKIKQYYDNMKQYNHLSHWRRYKTDRSAVNMQKPVSNHRSG